MGPTSWSVLVTLHKAKKGFIATKHSSLLIALSRVYIGKGYATTPATATVIEIYFRSKMSMVTVNAYLPWPPWAGRHK